MPKLLNVQRIVQTNEDAFFSLAIKKNDANGKRE